VLVIHRHLEPILAHTLDVKKRRDWPTIRDHIAAVRAGQVPVDPTGFALATQAETAPIDHAPERS
jgi:hypothetical protein